MQRQISIPPPADFRSYGPSRLFRFFFQLGRWTEESFSSDFQTYTRGTLVSSVTVNKWKNHNVIPTRYAGPLFRFIQGNFETSVAKTWIEAFEIVWATYSARADDVKEERPEDFNNAVPADSICEQHSRWIGTLYQGAIFGENFSAQDLYVALETVERQGSDLTLYETADILNLFQAENAATETSGLTLITGGAGAGKSMTALHLATKLVQTDVLPIYLRGQFVSEIDIDIHDTNLPVIDSFSARSFIKHFRASSHKTACLILDGVDEIPETEKGIIKFLSDLQLEQNVCRAHGKTLNLVFFARQDGVDLLRSAKPLSGFRHLEILELDGRLRGLNDTADINVGKDLRPVWWNKYLTAVGRKPEKTLPDFLAFDYADFRELGATPLWAYLICQTAMETNTNESLPASEAVNKLTYTQNRNIIYRNIVSYISNGASSVHNRESLNKSAHETLSHYLIAERIIDRFIELINAREDPEFEEALKNWSDVSAGQTHVPVLADFCRNEVSLRFTGLNDLQWETALSVIKDRLDIIHYSGAGLNAVSEILNSASLLFFIWSCFNLEKYKTSGVPHSFSENPKEFSFSTIRQIQRPNFLNFQDNSIIEPRLARHSFLSASLSALHLIEADLSQLNFSTGHLEAFSCEKSVFALTHWSHVKISSSSFKKSAFQQAIFHACRWQDTELSSCLFQATKIQSSGFLKCRLSEAFFSQCHFADVDFSASSYKNVIFDRCVFTNCSFETETCDAQIEGVEFRYSTFLSMDKYLKKFPARRLVHCVSPPVADSEKILIGELF